jgi:nitronate monooxygenase
VELRRLHPDIMERTRNCRDHDTMAESNLEALDREIKAARDICKTAGFLAVNIMRALPHYADQVRQACISGANAIIMGAGLPFDLPDLVRGHDEVALIPILSEERGVRAVLKKWMRKDRLPDAIVIEHPRYAGGHLGSPRIEDVGDPKYDFDHVLKAVREVIQGLGIKVNSIPLIPAGGINSFKSLKKLFSMGASGVQIGTPFAVTEEGDAHPNFKRVLAEATPENIVTFMSTAGLPARAVLTPWLKHYLSREEVVRAKADPEQAKCVSNLNCLSHCGFKSGNPAAGQFCIANRLAAAQRGDVEGGLFFRGSESLPFGKQIRTVREVLEFFLTDKFEPAPSEA